MNKVKLKNAYEKYRAGCPYSDPELWRKNTHAIQKAALPEHRMIGKSEFMSDWVECSCGWKSIAYWDLYEQAMDDWRIHVLKESNK